MFFLFLGVFLFKFLVDLFISRCFYLFYDVIQEVGARRAPILLVSHIFDAQVTPLGSKGPRGPLREATRKKNAQGIFLDQLGAKGITWLIG